MEASAYTEFRECEARHWWFIGRKAIFMHLIRWLLHSRPRGVPSRALDLGCGMGGMLDDLAELTEVYGTDVSRECLDHCRGRGHARLFRASAAALPLADGSLDLVCAFDTLEHIPEERESIAECFRLLRPGGLLFVSVPAYQFLYTHQDKVVHHQRRYTAGNLARKLTSQGFRVIRTSYINFLLFPAILTALLFIKARQAVIPPGDEHCSSNVSVPVPDWANRLLAGVFSFERHLLVGCSVPVGHTLIAVGRKPGVPG